jgi:hypothetical protein
VRPFLEDPFTDRVARWYNLKPKIPIWVNFGGTWNGRYWYFCDHFGQFSSHLINFMVFWYILWPFLMLWKEKSGNPVYRCKWISCCTKAT